MALPRTSIHWRTREFHHFLMQRAHEPFSWGKNDCALFAADAIKSFTGVDLADDFRGKYSDEATARLAIKTICNGTSVVDAAVHCAQKHGLLELQHPLMAQRGDLVIVQDVSGLIAGIVHLNGRHVVSPGDTGLKRLPISNVKRAWRV